jgi:type VI secretion system protein
VLAERLLERLIRRGEATTVDRRSPERLGEESVRRHLSRLLNTRLGAVPANGRYGMPDLHNVAGSAVPGKTSDIVGDMLEQIARFEPRLLNPNLVEEREEREVLTLKFRLSGQIEVGTLRAKAWRDVFFVIRINSAGKVTLEGIDGL